MKYITTVDGRDFLIELLEDGRVSVDGVTYKIDFLNVSGQPVYTLLADGKSYEALVLEGEDHWQVILQGTLYTAQVEDEREKRLRLAGGAGVAQSGEFVLKAPMPGLVVQVPVGEGQQVEEGNVLVILESMKMQNELKAPRAGRVTRLRVEAGDSVEQRQALLSLE